MATTAVPTEHGARLGWPVVAMVAGAALFAWGFADLDPDQRRDSAGVMLLGIGSGVGACMIPLTLESKGLRILRIALLVPTVAVLPTALVQTLGGAAIGRVLLGAALLGAGVTLLLARRGRGPSA